MKWLKVVSVFSLVILLSISLVGCGSSSGPADSSPARSIYDLPDYTPAPPVPQHVDSPIAQQSDTMWIAESENALIEMNFRANVQETPVRVEDITARGRFSLVQTRYWEKIGLTHILGPDSTFRDTLTYLVGIDQTEKELASETFGISSQILEFASTVETAFGDSGVIETIPNQSIDEHRVNIRSTAGVTTVFTVWQLVNRFDFTDGDGNIVDDTMLDEYARNWLAIEGRPVEADTTVTLHLTPQPFEVREDLLYWQVVEF